MEEFETKYYETKAKLQNILENLSVRTYVYNDNSDVFENVSNMKSSNFKLPKINIERFSGDYKDWPSFKDLYVSLVHDNKCLSNIQKFQYLRDLLRSEPANIIKHIPITETAYNEAWEKLLARYDEKKQIIFSLIKTFMEQPSFNNTNSHNLRNIADTSDEVIRGTKSTKDYIALFVCLATKAVHIEAVGDLTIDSFIAALRRFSARRGAPRHIYSDNGTNFVGARRKLDEIRKLWLSLPTNEAISYYLSKSSIDWHFNLPSSPHFGGIWESGIRSVKFHLKRVLGETILTFEELTTLLTQIEGLLNSRPLSYVNDSDIECISTLTPSHFLTGDVLLSVPEELPSTSNHRDRWELLQNIKRGFWKKWSSEFISSLQPRKQWQDAQPNLKEDDIVLIKEEGPPGTWPMARVLQVHPGNDGLVRVATVKTQDSVLKRPVHKLHKLPIYPN
ncbi:integrase catalytic domain-containing protein [Trichonephila clavipes]|nr:integrase catalytic domain-containing protein [Trichonephila clavipes]